MQIVKDWKIGEYEHRQTLRLVIAGGYHVHVETHAEKSGESEFHRAYALKYNEAGAAAVLAKAGFRYQELENVAQWAENAIAADRRAQVAHDTRVAAMTVMLKRGFANH